jgi:hypothetical protein
MDVQYAIDGSFLETIVLSPKIKAPEYGRPVVSPSIMAKPPVTLNAKAVKATYNQSIWNDVERIGRLTFCFTFNRPFFSAAGFFP